MKLKITTLILLAGFSGFSQNSLSSDDVENMIIKPYLGKMVVILDTEYGLQRTIITTQNGNFETFVNYFDESGQISNVKNQHMIHIDGVTKQYYPKQETIVIKRNSNWKSYHPGLWAISGYEITDARMIGSTLSVVLVDDFGDKYPQQIETVNHSIPLPQDVQVSTFGSIINDITVNTYPNPTAIKVVEYDGELLDWAVSTERDKVRVIKSPNRTYAYRLGTYESTNKCATIRLEISSSGITIERMGKCSDLVTQMAIDAFMGKFDNAYFENKAPSSIRYPRIISHFSYGISLNPYNSDGRIGEWELIETDQNTLEIGGLIFKKIN